MTRRKVILGIVAAFLIFLCLPFNWPFLWKVVLMIVPNRASGMLALPKVEELNEYSEVDLKERMIDKYGKSYVHKIYGEPAEIDEQTNTEIYDLDGMTYRLVLRYNAKNVIVDASFAEK